MLALLLAFISLADARQRAYALTPGDSAYALDARFDDAAGETHRVRAQLDAAAMKGDRALIFDTDDVAKDTATAVRQWATREKVSVTAKARKGGVYISVKGSSRAAMRKLLDRAADVRDAAYADALTAHGMLQLRRGLTADHARMAREHAAALRPLARALADGTRDARSFAARALAFAQNVPYKAGGNEGVRTPIGVLVKNRGDCDSKTTLFLSLLRAAHPDVPAAIVYVRGHALAAIGLDPRKGDATLKVDGRTWVLAEPVGPRLMDVGEIGGATRWKLGRAELREL
jgi:hypothetical protein